MRKLRRGAFFSQPLWNFHSGAQLLRPRGKPYVCAEAERAEGILPVFASFWLRDCLRSASVRFARRIAWRLSECGF